MFLNISFLNSIDLKRIIKNIFGATSSFVSSIIIQLLFIPFMLIAWGPKNTGLWLFITSIPSAITFWKLSFSEACRQEVILKGKKFKNKIYSISLILTFGVIILSGLIFFILNIFYLKNFIIFNDIKINNLNYILVIIFITFCLEIIINNILIISQYKGKIYLSNYVQNSFLLVEKLSVPICGFFTDKIILAAALVLIFKIIKYPLTRYILSKHNLIFVFKKKLLKINSIKKIFNKSLKFYYNDVSSIINTSGLIFIVGIFFNSETVAFVGAATIMFRFSIIRLLGIITKFMSFEIPILFKRKNLNKLVNILNLQQNIIYLCILLSSIVIFFYGEFIFDVWTSGTFTHYEKEFLFLIWLEAIIFILSYNKLILGMYLNKLDNTTLRSLIVTVMIYILLIISLNVSVDLKNLFIFLIIKNIIIYTIYFQYNEKIKKNLFIKVI